MRLWVPGPQCELNGGVQPNDYCRDVQADDQQANRRLREGSSSSDVAIRHDRSKRAVATNRTPECAATAGDYIEVRTAAVRVRRSPSEHDRLTLEHARSQRDQPDRTRHD